MHWQFYKFTKLFMNHEWCLYTTKHCVKVWLKPSTRFKILHIPNSFVLQISWRTLCGFSFVMFISWRRLCGTIWRRPCGTVTRTGTVIAMVHKNGVRRRKISIQFNLFYNPLSSPKVWRVTLHEFCYIDLYQGKLIYSDLSKFITKYDKYLQTATNDDS